MAITQLSVFAENKPGVLSEITHELASANIDIRAMSIADSSHFGIFRLIVDDTEKARAVLSEAGFVVAKNHVIAAAVPDTPGALTDIMNILSDNKINIEYMYAFITVSKKYAYVVLRVPDRETATKLLEENGVILVSDDDIKKL